MAQIILYPENEINSKTIFEVPTSITIDAIHNKYQLSLNFSKGDTINSGEKIYIENSISIEDLETINDIRQSDGHVTVEYTEI
tara:strand:- start:162 stop:410 length:249 start_codon:yes stop_codon:yes gene_type:complete